VTADSDDTTDPGSSGSAPDDSGNTPGADLVGVAVEAKAVRGHGAKTAPKSSSSQHSATTPGW